MPGQVIGTIGQEDVRLENAATESTMLLLLQAMERLDKKSGKKGGADKTQELYNKALTDGAATKEKETKKVRDLNKELDDSKKKFKDITSDLDGIMRTLSAGIGKVFGDATPSVEGFTKAFDGIPIVGGVISTLGGILGENIKTFRNLSAVGIDLGKGIYAVQTAAANAGLSVESFTQAIKENSAGLAIFGGTASQGAMVFSNIMGNIKKSGASQALGRLGMTMDEVASNTASYMEIQAQTGTGAKKTQAELTQGSIDYNLELDKLSRATGLSRKTLDEANKSAARDAKMKMVLANLSGEERTAFLAKVEQLKKVDPTGKLAAGLVDLVSAGGVAITRESQMLTMAAQDAGVDITSTARSISQGVKGSVKGLDNDFAQIGRKGQQMTEEQRALGSVLAGQQKDSIFLYQSAATGMVETADATDKAAQAQAEALKDQEKNAANVDQALVDLQNNLKTALLPLLQAFATIISTQLIPFLIGLAPKIEQLGTFIGTSVVPAFQALVDWFATKSIGEIMLTALAAGITLMFARAAASRLLESAFDRLLGGRQTATTVPDTSKDKNKNKPPPSKDKPGLGRRLLSGGKGFGVGTVVNVGADMVADAVGRDTKAGAGIDVLGQTAGMAGTGALLGSVVPGVGTVVGGAIGGTIGAGMGLWQNRKTLFGGSSSTSATQNRAVPEVKVDPKLAKDWAWSIISGKATIDEVPKGYENAVLAILSNPPKEWLSAPGAGSATTSPGSAGSITPATPVDAAALSVAQTRSAAEIRELSAALKELDYNKLMFPDAVVASMSAGTTQAKDLKAEVLSLAASFKELNNTGLDKVTQGIARLDESFKSFNKSFVEDFITKFKELDKKSQETLLTDIGQKLDTLNIGIASLIDIQQDAAKGIGKTAKYTRQSSGNLL